MGPGEGLSANRNHALALVSDPYPLFLDDDCRVGEDFVATAFECLETHESRSGHGKVVVTGAERRKDAIIEPASRPSWDSRAGATRPGPD